MLLLYLFQSFNCVMCVLFESHACFVFLVEGPSFIHLFLLNFIVPDFTQSTHFLYIFFNLVCLLASSQPQLLSGFCLILFNRLTRGEISGYVSPPSPLIRLLELYVFLSISSSFIHLSASKQYTVYPKQVVIVTGE